MDLGVDNEEGGDYSRAATPRCALLVWIRVDIESAGRAARDRGSRDDVDGWIGCFGMFWMDGLDGVRLLKNGG